MTLLIKKQLFTMLIMCLGGLATGIVIYIFSLFKLTFFCKLPKVKYIINMIEVVVIAYLVGEYSYFCQNGKLTVTGLVSFFVGLLLWYKYFYDIISLGDKNEQKREETP